MAIIEDRNRSRVTISEWRYVASIILIILVISSLPYIYANYSSPANKQFMGVMLDVPDHYQYFSWMRELTHGHLASNKLTAEPNQPVFFNLLWWLMGRFGRLLGLGFSGMFQILRITATILFLTVAYHFCAFFLHEQKMRKISFLIISLSSGFGWVLVLLKYTVTNGELLYPLDVYIAEGNTFLGVLAYPHFIAAASCQVKGPFPDFFAGNGIEGSNDCHIGVIVGQAPFVDLLLKQF